MKKFSVLIIFLLGVSNFIIAQIFYSSTVYESNSTKPIPYAIVKVKNKNIGIVSNEFGKFILSDQSIEDGDSIIITCLGYKPKVYSIRDWNNELSIYMESDPILLNEATVTARKAKQIKIGITNGGTKTFFIPLFTKKELSSNKLIGREIGTIFEIENNCRIKDINIFVANNKYENIKMRAIFYRVENGLPKEIIVNRDIIFNISDKNGWVKIDISQYNIQFTKGQQISLTFMTLDEKNKDQFFIFAKMFSKHGLLRRDTALGNWKKSKGGMSVYLSGYVN